ncbi:MAG: helix-turn-helix transcriptional regulator [Clostridia bacterium]|nr:helix-turn-helix transcriptional regulator [Clostridia bacterium]
MDSFKNRLKEVRTERNYSQAKLANLLYISQAAIAKWETGDREPDFEMLVKLCKVLEVSADYLLGLID